MLMKNIETVEEGREEDGAVTGSLFTLLTALLVRSDGRTFSYLQIPQDKSPLILKHVVSSGQLFLTKFSRQGCSSL